MLPIYCVCCEILPATKHLDNESAALCGACDAGDFSDIVAEYEADPEIMEDCRYIAGREESARHMLIDSGYTTRAAVIAVTEIVQSIIDGTSPLYATK